MQRETIISTDEISRRKFLLQVLLVSIIILALFAFLSNFYGFLFIKRYTGENPLVTGSALLLYCSLFYLSGKTNIKYISYIFVFSLFIFNIFISLNSGADLPVSLLFYSLIIVIAGMLLSSANGIFISILSAIVIFTISYLQIKGLYHINESWKERHINMQDTIVYAVMLGVISIVSLLSNREIEKSLKRAKDSEEALQKERDTLEETVERRTAQLRQAEIEKIAQFYRSIEFGKLAVGLFHDLMTPLNLVSLNLENINEENKISDKDKVTNIKKYIRRAMYGTKRLEIFIAIARKQIQSSKHFQHFSLSAEMDHVIKLFRYSSNVAKVTIQYKHTEELKYDGNPLKFNQIITNLLSNAIDSYATISKVKKKKVIMIELYKKGEEIFLIVSDNGIGMNEKDIKKIFDPLFTTKEQSHHMGLGLYLIKEIVQKDFKGTISVKSKLSEGTTFSIAFPATRR